MGRREELGPERTALLGLLQEEVLRRLPPEDTKKIHHGMGPRTAGRRVCAVQAFLPQAKILAEAEFTSAEHFNHRRVEAASGRRNPQKRTSIGCPFLW